MLTRLCGTLVRTTLLGTAVLAAAATAPAQTLPPAPVPVLPEAEAPPPPPAGATLAQPVPVPGPFTAAPVPPPPPPGPPPYTVPVPGPAAPVPLSPPAPYPWFADVELQILHPSLRYGLQAVVPVSNTGPNPLVAPPSTSLDWTVSPRFEVGYRMPNVPRLFAVSYRFLVSEGSATEPVDGFVAAVRTRLSLNEVTLDYGSLPFSFAPNWDAQWRLGINWASIFFDSRADLPFLFEQASSYFSGAGPHGRLDLYRHLAAVPGLSLFGRLDGVVLVGQVEQHYRFAMTDADGNTFGAALFQRRTTAVPVLTVQAGLSYTPPRLPRLHLSTGYQFQDYWNLGRFHEPPDAAPGVTANADLITNGVYLRALLDF